MTHREARLPPVVVTRAEASDGPLSAQLRSLGLKVLLWPAVEVTVQRHSRRWMQALQKLGEFDWIVFASRNAVAAVMSRVPVQPPTCSVAAVGTRNRAGAASARLAAWISCRTKRMPARSSSAFAPLAKAGMRVLFPASSRALPTIIEGPRAARRRGHAGRGLSHRARRARRRRAAASWIERDAIGAVTFASPSAVDRARTRARQGGLRSAAADAAAVAIGPTTARALSDAAARRSSPKPPPCAGSPPRRCACCKRGTDHGIPTCNDRDACANPTPGGAWSRRRGSPPTRSSIRSSSCPESRCASPSTSMPGVIQLSVDEAVKEAQMAADSGVLAVILFAAPAAQGCEGERRARCRRTRAAGDPRDQEGLPEAHRLGGRVPLRRHGSRPLRPRDCRAASSTTTPPWRRWRRCRSPMRRPAPMPSRRAT